MAKASATFFIIRVVDEPLMTVTAKDPILALNFLSRHPGEDSPALAPGELHLWKIPCGQDGGDPERLWPSLSAAEQCRADRFKPPGHRETYIRAHAGLRHILSPYLGMAPSAIPFEQGPQGKPWVAGPLEFNLTTTRDLALVALRRDEPVGIDCERISGHRDMLAIGQRVFSAAEQARLQEAPATERPLLFTLFWTALEARVKLNGQGLFQPPASLAHAPAVVAHFVPHRDYLAAIAGTQLPPRIAWKAWWLAW